MRSRIHFVLAALAAATLPGCAATFQTPGFRIGSATSKNLFVSSSQFANKEVRLRLRNSSGDPSIDMAKMRTSVESGLRSAGYSVGGEGAGIVMDVNLYFMGNVASGRQRAGNEVGALLGGVTGYEAGRRAGGVSAVSGAILGAVAGATLQEVVRAHNEYDSYLVLCDVNLGVVRQESKSRDSFVIGGNRIEHKEEEERATFDSFALRETVKVAVYAGDRRENHGYVIQAMQDRLSRMVANLL
ncbi:outer membrane lipoprotein SlyB [Hydrogenophaga palleronii]|uniref:Outer membrane lipoprotein SlyB n=1 Tax=Hydrogenophaga palleronii TaxID=65655 RepID=A0ABU1WNA5_9BURK|nr:complement resistance protein TraT [Hydrogenophaga palleronii]MDR7150776.1 outer membrane lipoprotein SlyB [Hydrogenophaga palleronii]